MAIELITAPHLKKIPRLVHAFTTRRGGVSTGAYASLNLGRVSGDDDRHVDENYHVLCSGLGIAEENLAISRQVHGKECIVLDETSDLDELQTASADILMTQSANVFLVIRTADCLPIMLVDESTHSLAHVHAGWRGTLAGAVTHAMTLMKEKFKCEASQIKIAIGPGISVKHFEVSLGVSNLFKEAGYTSSEDVVEQESSAYINLSSINVKQALKMGALKENIWESHMCTYADEKRFFSYRRDGKHSGRLAGVLGWKA